MASMTIVSLIGSFHSCMIVVTLSLNIQVAYKNAPSRLEVPTYLPYNKSTTYH